MKTLLMNGSPNGRRGNTELLSREFAKGMAEPPEIRYLAEEDAASLAEYMQGFDCWLFFFPLYVNAMPGIVKRLFEQLSPDEGKAVGYFVQSGFDEAAQSDYLAALLKNFTERMRYRDLGTVIAGGMAAVRFMPERMNQKTFAAMRRVGALYEETGVFADESVRHFGRLYRYGKAQLRLNELCRRLGLTNLFWNSMLKKNKAYQNRLDKPFGH